MGKIFYLMGKSSSGKDTVYKRLMSEERLSLAPIVQYTTRPIRVNETDGTEYYFVSGQRMEELQNMGKVIEARNYNTCFGIWTYATVQDEHVDLSNQNYLMIGTLESFSKVRAFFGADKVLPLMIECDDGVRLQRALNRERNEEEPKYEEMCRRFLADAVDFSEENKQKAGIGTVFNNEDLEHCLEEISDYIQRNL